MELRSEAPNRFINRRQALIGVAALVAGTAVYLLDRPAGQLALIPPDWVLSDGQGSVSGILGGVLPDFLHPFAFAMLTGSLLAPSRLRYGIACLVWATIDLAFETGQAPTVSKWLAATIGPWKGRIPGVESILSYFGNGTYDPLDVLATIAGAVMAWLLLQKTGGHDGFHFRIKKT